jgi:hypothetical protein
MFSSIKLLSTIGAVLLCSLTCTSGSPINTNTPPRSLDLSSANALDHLQRRACSSGDKRPKYDLGFDYFLRQGLGGGVQNGQEIRVKHETPPTDSKKSCREYGLLDRDGQSTSTSVLHGTISLCGQKIEIEVNRYENTAWRKIDNGDKVCFRLRVEELCYNDRERTDVWRIVEKQDTC